jgi:catechol 2,3-dioxygenase-like lactoylglutathione lyase family enzyme/enamine deaminase RidA (YjgF/YER057c/UK114 family)
LIEVSGTTAVRADGTVTAHGDVYGQTGQALETIGAALTELGASLENVIRTRVLLRDIEGWAEAGRAHREVFADIRPASTCLGGLDFLLPEILVEVEATALVIDRAGGGVGEMSARSAERRAAAAPRSVRRINHISFVVSDIERSVDWYCRYLGLEVETRQRQDNEYTRTLVGIPGAVLEIALLRVPGEGSTRGPMLELIEYVKPGGGDVDAAINDVGATHLAFEVGDLRALYAELESEGLAFQTSPIAIEEGVNRGGYTCYLADPDGNRLEIHEPPVG